MIDSNDSLNGDKKAGGKAPSAPVTGGSPASKKPAGKKKSTTAGANAAQPAQSTQASKPSTKPADAAAATVAKPSDTSGASSARTSEPPKQMPAAARPEPTRAEIAARAFELFVRRGRTGGTPESDWLQAERELREERVPATRDERTGRGPKAGD